MSDAPPTPRRLRSSMMIKQYSSGRGFATFVQHFKANNNENTRRKQDEYEKRSIVVEYSRGGFPWHIVIDTPAGHGDKMNIVQGVEPHHDEFEHEEEPTDVSQMLESFPQYFEERFHTETTSVSSQEMKSPHVSSKDMQAAYNEYQRSSRNISEGDVAWSEWKEEMKRLQDNRARGQPQGKEKDVMPPPQQPPTAPQPQEGELMEDFGQRPTRRLVGMRRRFRRILGAEVVQTYGDNAPRDQIAAKTGLLCCCRSIDVVEPRAPNHIDFGMDDDAVLPVKTPVARNYQDDEWSSPGADVEADSERALPGSVTTATPPPEVLKEMWENEKRSSMKSQSASGGGSRHSWRSRPLHGSQQFSHSSGGGSQAYRGSRQSSYYSSSAGKSSSTGRSQTLPNSRQSSYFSSSRGSVQTATSVPNQYTGVVPDDLEYYSSPDSAETDSKYSPSSSENSEHAKSLVDSMSYEDSH